MNLLNYMIVLIVTTTTIATAPTINVVFIIQSSDAQHHTELSKKLKKDIIKQSKELQPTFRVTVHLLHELFNYPGGWTIHNLIPQLMSYQRQQQQHIDTFAEKPIDTVGAEDVEVINDKTRWIVFCEDKTKVKVKLLMENLNYENHLQPLFLGHPLYDSEPTIIHHFAFFDNSKWFPYPMIRAGIVLSMPLVKSIAEIYNNQSNNNSKLFKQQFSIDAGHELARFIYDNMQVPLKSATATATAYRNPNANCVNERSSNTISNIKENFPTKTGEHFSTLLNSSYAADDEGTTTISVLSSTDVRTMTTNGIKDLHEIETFKPSGDKNITTTTKTKTKATSSIIKKQKIILKKASFICPTAAWDSSRSNMNNNNVSCAMYAEQTVNPVSTMAGAAAVRREEIYFAVKTCSKYHNERLPIIQATWAPYAKHIKYFSDTQVDSVPTQSTGVPNVEMGHCAKTLKILELALNDIAHFNKKQHPSDQDRHANYQIKWLFLSDDDTLLSISGVCQVLGCYDSMAEIYLGERYGYRLFAQDGFNYITGGGGIAFSLPTVKLILQHCSCPSATAPDDMILGSCLHSLQLRAVHSSRFHQARPNDYALELLQQEPPISFHKFWQLDPIDVYKQWFAAADEKLFDAKNLEFKHLHKNNQHFPTRKLLAKKDSLNLHKIPVDLMASVQHTKQQHVDL